MHRPMEQREGPQTNSHSHRHPNLINVLKKNTLWRNDSFFDSHPEKTKRIPISLPIRKSTQNGSKTNMASKYLRLLGQTLQDIVTGHNFLSWTPQPWEQ